MRRVGWNDPWWLCGIVMVVVFVECRRVVVAWFCCGGWWYLGWSRIFRDERTRRGCLVSFAGFTSTEGQWDRPDFHLGLYWYNCADVSPVFTSRAPVCGVWRWRRGGWR